ncbi:MAG: cation:proton antiporter [Patescibacteria group bacterium]
MENHESFFYVIILTVSFLLFISSLAAVFIKRLYLPYTVVLVIVGIILSVFSRFELFDFLNVLQLSPDLVFYLFLPMLVFEGAYNIRFLELKSSLKTVSVMSIVSLLISAFFIGAVLFYLFSYFGIAVPFITLLLFGSLISATDPIAALAIFREIGVAKRLRLLLDGESLFNDGTALVLFQVVMSVALAGTFSTGILGTAFVKFWILVIGGAALGAIMGWIFSKIIERVHNLATVEITLTLILAHTAFIFAEKFFGVSGVIAALSAGLMVGNFGRYKISPSVRDFMEHFWSYAAFLANSLIFLLIGLSLRGVSLFEYWLPVLITLIVVMIARFVSVFGVVPFTNKLFKREGKIPASWQFLLSWGGLRGALPLAIVLLLPADFEHKNLLLVLTLSTVFFTLLIQATTIKKFIKHFKLDIFSSEEELAREEVFLMMDKRIKRQLENMAGDNRIPKEVYEKLDKMYSDLYAESKNRLDKLVKKKGEFSNYEEMLVLLRKQALNLERRAYLKLFDQHELSERIFASLDAKIERQIDRIDRKMPQILEKKISFSHIKKIKDYSYWLLQSIQHPLAKKLSNRLKLSETIHDYILYRTRKFGSEEVLRELAELHEDANDTEHQKALQIIMAQYKKWRQENTERLGNIRQADPKLVAALEYTLANLSSLNTEIEILEDMHKKGIVSENIFSDVYEYYQRLYAQKQNLLLQSKYRMKKDSI